MAHVSPVPTSSPAPVLPSSSPLPPRHPHAPDTRDTGTGSVPASLCVSDPGTGSAPAGRETSRPGNGFALPIPVGVAVQEIYFPF